MKYIFSDWERIKKILQDKSIYLFLDYDGTLTPIVNNPKKAFLAKDTKKTLQQLSELPNCKILIVSGRALNDVKRRVGLKNIVYVGNHGLEVKGPKVKFKSPIPIRYRKTLKEIKARLKKRLSPIDGAFVEDKGFSLSVHYRLVDKKCIPFVRAVFYSTTLPYEVRHDIKTATGKMTLEAMPDVKWDKGKIVLWLLRRRRKAFPIYIGDDVTDEDAFKSLKNKGITIFVGKPDNVNADFYLRNPKEAVKLLRLIWKSKKK